MFAKENKIKKWEKQKGSFILCEYQRKEKLKKMSDLSHFQEET